MQVRCAAELTLCKAVVDAQRYHVHPEILSERGRIEAIRRLQAIKAVGEERSTPKLLDQLEWTACPKRREEAYAIT